MPRPKRCRRICSIPEYSEFSPHGQSVIDSIFLTIDEFETIRLIDYEKQTHEQCAMQMEISRTTVTEMYETARYKIADSILHGKRLCITGGNYRLCDGSAKCCRKQQCPLLRDSIIVKEKGQNIMRVAVTYENGAIFQHFGHTSQFKLYDIADGKIVSTAVIDTMENGHGALAGFLKVNQIDTLICGGIGGGAQVALAQAGIQLYGGVSGDADAAVQNLLDGTLAFNPDVHCNHHDHENGSHGCENHGCGSHNCHA